MSSFNLSLPIAIGSDHAGFNYKTALVNYLEQKGYAVKDFGTYSSDSVDYPDYAHRWPRRLKKAKWLSAFYSVALPMGSYYG